MPPATGVLSDYKKLLTKRDTLVRAILHHEEKIKHGSTRTQAMARMSQLEGAFTKYEAIMEKIEDHDDFDNDHLEISNEEVIESYINTLAVLKSVTKDANESMSLEATIADRSNNYSQDIKLPRISIPTFSGKELEWTTFYDTFSSLVDKNQNIPKVSKMHYLRDCLSDSAFRTISKLPVSDVNYDIAWKILQDTYHNKRAIVNDCLKTFLFQEPIKSQNANDIRSLIDNTRESIQCIESLDISIDDWDPFLVYVLQTKLDKDTAIDWERKLGGSKEIPKYSEFLDFLETQYRIINTPTEMLSASHKDTQRKYKTSTNINGTKRDVCTVCRGEHYILFCELFNSWNVQQRKKYANDNNLCHVCLKNHDPQSCKSKFLCKKCNGHHSTKLHEETPAQANSSYENRSMQIHAINASATKRKLLATAIVKVKDKFGIDHLMRVFIDPGSEGTLISEKAAQLLCLPRKKDTIPFSGIDNQPLGKSKSSVQIQVQSTVDDSFIMSVQAFVIRSVTASSINFDKSIKNLKHLNELQFADPDFMLANKADLLFGVDIYGIIIKEGLKKGQLNEPVAQNSALGWLVFGAASNQKDFSIRIHATTLSDDLKKFWESEEVEVAPIMTEEHKKCFDLCNESTKRLPNGKLQVSLPFNIDKNAVNFLGDSRKMALRRYFHLEKKFENNSEFFERYKADMLSYLQCNHMSLSKSPLNVGYYLPHHAVVRENSVKTKQRTVYDASAKSANGFSLNDRCLNGPTIQPELFDTFIRWRTYKVALVADIEKMYRQISIAPEDRKYQKILWRFSKNEPIQTYELNTVTFGVKPAPFMAINATFHLAEMEKDNFPEASKRVKTDFYVDDCMSGENTVESALRLQKELNGLFTAGHMKLRQWASNHETALDGIPSENRALSQSLKLNTDQTVKTLGMTWTPATDTVNFTIDLSNLSKETRTTKRKLLSDASKLYDPCGILAPITVKSKMMMQELFKSKTDWDDYAAIEIQTEWDEYRNELPLIKTIRIDRWLKTEAKSAISLHGFCDSSQKAFAAVIYLVQNSNGKATSSLVCAKTRVAPIDPVSIPRLELCGAVLLKNLMARISKNLKIKEENVYLWTDSSIVIAWLQSHASRWRVYVSHRVCQIQKKYPAPHWRHVRTHENPADIASRGALPSQLIDNKLWFHGPDWLCLPEENWPKVLPIVSPNVHVEERIHINMVTEAPREIETLLRFSNWSRLIRVTAYMLRFVYRNLMRNETLRYSNECLTVAELHRAKLIWIKYVQSIHFKQEINDLQKHGCVSEKSTLRQLNPSVENGVLVVKGRLTHANMPERQKFPIILPAKSHLTQIVISKAHNDTLHGTIHLTLARVRQEFWILNGRNLVKSHVHKCIQCYRQNPKPMNQLMGPLPAIKTTPARAFLHCGLDFAGPIELKSSNKRNAPTEKGYICVFVCMASKAAHLELVGDLSTQRFILALRRMMARRGLCSDIYCDRGTNFQGANNELPRLFLEAQSNASTEITNTFANDSITFHFNPPSAPNWGGQWESFVKLTKHHLRRTSASIKLTYEEMSTLLAQIEACINSRPLSAITADINDFEPLTAGHLLIGAPLNMIPEPTLLTLKDNTLDRFQAIQKGLQIFWKRFYEEYLHAQKPRKKWYKPQENIAVGDLVVVIDENMPPAKWMMARVKEIHQGQDGYVRMVTLKTKHSELQRPVVKLCKLPGPGGCSE